MPATRTRLLISGCVLTSALCIAPVASAQTSWERTYGGTDYDCGGAVQPTTGGGYVVVGFTKSLGAGDRDVYLIKTNASGDTQWTRTYGGTGMDDGYSIQRTTDGGFIVTGYTYSFGAGGSDVYLVKTNVQGDTLWTRTYGGTGNDIGYSVVQTTDGGFIVAGYTSSFGAGDNDVYLVKTDSQGDTVWTRTYGGASDDHGFSVQQTADGGYILAAGEIGLIKTNALGDTLWTRTCSRADSNWVWCHSVQVTPDGGYFVAGTTSRPSFSCDFYLVKTDIDGDTLWTRTYGGADDDVSYSVEQTTDGGCIQAGYTWSFGTGMADFYLVRTNAQGDTLWTRTYGGTGVDYGYFAGLAADDGYVITGQTYSFGAGSSDVYLVKTADNLNVGPVAVLSPTGTVDSGVVQAPRAVVRNFGLTLAAFPVTFSIGTGYSQTVQETLASGITDTVVFPSWTAEPMGPLAVTCFTSLLGDEDPTNDTIVGSVRVVPPARHDAGATAILQPGILRPGDALIPRARIRNFGNTVERFFDVRFVIGASYNRTVNVADALPPDSTIAVAFPAWVAEAGDWAVSCSTMLVDDADRTNDKVSFPMHVTAQALRIEPDQSHGLQAGENETYQFYALLDGDTGGIVAVAKPSSPPGWSAKLCDATGEADLTDTDSDGIPDLGYLAPAESGRFSLEVTAPLELSGDTTSIKQATFLVEGYVSDYPLAADTALLSLTLLPAFSVHNFPNPFSDKTSFVIGLPEDGKASLTIYTRTGERVCRVLANSDLAAGVHLVPWNGVNDHGRTIAPGTYEYLLEYVHAGRTERIRNKLVLTRR